MDDPSLSVLRRKVGAGRAEPEFGTVSPAKALRLGVSKAAQDVLRAPMSAEAIDEGRATLQSMAQVLPDRALNVLLHGLGEARGVLSLDQTCLAAVLQALTLGRFSDGPAPDRQPTSTDAMLARRFVAVLMQVFAAALDGHPASVWASGFGPRDRIDDLRRLPHLLADVSYRLFAITVEIGGGMRQGRMVLALPADGATTADGAALPGADLGADWSDRIERQVLDSPATLEAVLGRMRLTLSDLAAMRPGDVLTLPARSVAEVSLEGVSGEQVGTARLGQVDGNRALCLTGLAISDATGGQDRPGSEVVDEVTPPPVGADGGVTRMRIAAAPPAAPASPPSDVALSDSSGENASA